MKKEPTRNRVSAGKRPSAPAAAITPTHSNGDDPGLSLAHSILDQTAEAILVCDAQGRVVLASRSAYRLCDRDPLQHPFADVLPLRQGRGPRPWHLRERRRQPRLGPPVSSVEYCRGDPVRAVPVHLPRGDGQCLNLLMTAGPLRDGDDQPVGCIMSLTDVTERTRAEDALLESQARFERMAESNIIGIVSADAQAIRAANDAFLDIVGYTRDDLRGGHIRLESLNPREYRAALDEKFRELAGSGNVTPFEQEFVRKDGSRVPVLIGAILSDAEPFRWVGFIVDLAWRKSTEEELKDTKEHLEVRVRERTAELAEINRALEFEIAERERTEQALRQSRAEYQALLESAPDAIVSVDRNGIIALVNGQTEKMFGYARDELMGEPVETLLPTRFRNLHVQHRLDYAANPTTRPMGIGLALAGRRKDGTEFPVEISLSPVFMPEGVLTTSIIRDVTERRQAEESLARQTRRLQEQANLIELAHDTIIVRDMDNRIVFWNHGAEETYGWTKDQAIGQVTHEFLQTLFTASREQVDATLIEQGQWEGELVHSTRDGRRIVVASRQVLERDERNQPRAILEINRDITERRRAEEQLSESETRFRTLVEQVQDYAIFGLDTEGRVVSWNTGAERVYGYRAEEILGEHVSRFYLPQDVAGGKLQRELTMAATEGSYQEVGERIRKDGSRYWADVLITALREPNGDLRGFAKVTRDITRRKQAEEKIQKLNRELEQRVSELGAVNQELEAFSYSVSHDLRAPLRAIAGFSQALVEDYADVLDDQGKDYTRRIHAATQRLTQLIDDMLTLSRVTRTEMERDAVVDLSGLARSVAAQWQATYPERQVTWSIAPGLVARGDPRLVRVALENLIGNAWKFTSKAPEARIEFGQAGTEAGRPIYFVRDNGAGFDMAYADKLFGPFQRLHAVTEFPGTGIGLATVQRIVRRHGGRAWAEAAVGQGATFYFTL